MANLRYLPLLFAALLFCQCSRGENGGKVRRRFVPYQNGDAEFSANLARYRLKAGVYERQDGDVSEQLPFLLFRPSRKKPKTPMLLYFGGTGETGTDLSRHFRQKSLFERVTSDEFQTKHPCFLFAPMIKDHVEFSGALPEQPTECSDFVLEAMFAVVRALGDGVVDTNRLYTTGLSFGGCAAFEMICYYPDVFAAALPVSAVESEYMLPESKRVNMWCVENRISLSPIRESLYRRMRERVARTGGDFRISLFPQKGHNAWKDAWSEEAPWDWMFTKTRDGREIRMTASERKSVRKSAADLSWVICSSDLQPCSSNHLARCGADNLLKTYFRAESARAGNWWSLESADGISGDVVIMTGTPERKELLRHGIVETSNEGRHWRKVATIDTKTGEARFRISRPVRRIRVRCTGKSPQPLVVREVQIAQPGRNLGHR